MPLCMLLVGFCLSLQCLISWSWFKMKFLLLFASPEQQYLLQAKVDVQ